jgi:hypothetical protein
VLARKIQLGLFGFLAFGGLIAAEPPAVPPALSPERSVTVVAILASDKKPDIDPKVKCIASEVQKLEPSLTGFRLVRTTCKTVALGKRDQFPLVDDETVSIQLQEAPGGMNRIRVTAKAPKQGEITYDSCCSKFFPIMTRYQTKDGERLIIAIMVKTENKK